MAVRIARVTDADNIVKMAQEYYAEAGYEFAKERARAALRLLLTDNRIGSAWIAEVDGSPVAYGALTLGYSLEYGGPDAFVDELYVRPAYRGRGIGGAILGAMERECRTRGVRALHLEVEHANAALKLYRRFGFRDHERRLMTKLVDQDT